MSWTKLSKLYFMFIVLLIIIGGGGLWTVLHSAKAHNYKIGDLEIQHPWIRQPPQAAEVVGGFLTIVNHGKQDDRLIAVSTSLSKIVQLHNMDMKDGVMKMIELPEGIPIKAGETVELKPKSLHIMFIDLNHLPKQGEKIQAILEFERAGKIEVNFNVDEQNVDNSHKHG